MAVCPPGICIQVCPNTPPCSSRRGRFRRFLKLQQIQRASKHASFWFSKKQSLAATCSCLQPLAATCSHLPKQLQVAASGCNYLQPSAATRSHLPPHAILEKKWFCRFYFFPSTDWNIGIKAVSEKKQRARLFVFEGQRSPAASELTTTCLVIFVGCLMMVYLSRWLTNVVCKSPFHGS